MAKIKVLVLEDDRNILSSNIKILEWEGYEAIGAASLEEARRCLETCEPDAFVLDVNLPDGSGVDFCRELRPRFKGPVLFLTALNEKDDMLKGLRAGGNDYITKPFDVDELLARLSALIDLTRINREEEDAPHHREWGGLTMDVKSLRAYVKGSDINLSPKEFSVLLYLLDNEGVKVPAERLYRDVWMEPLLNSKSVLYKTISGINKKLADHDSDMVISNYRNEGYAIENT